MRYSKKALIIIGAICIIFFLGVTYELPFYIYKPGSADNLEEMVEVEDGYSTEGHMHLVTVSGGQASPFEYLLAKMYPYHEIVPIEKARPEGISDEEYMQYQLHLMDNSQHTSIVTAYEAAGENVHLRNNGAYVVSVVEGMAAEGVVELGDKIIQIDDRTIEDSSDLVDYVQEKEAHDTIELVINRDGKELHETVEVVDFPDEPQKVGIGIQLVTDEEVDVDKPVQIKSGQIGGPSAGLMFTMEMYNQLVEEDITKGHNIAGTGEIDEEGHVGRIGGIDKKVVTADKEDVEIFFAPNEEGAADSNYNEAIKTAKDIETDMEVVPVDTFDDALDYLQQLSALIQPSKGGSF